MKVMIVEDEILVRLGLRKAIPWSSLAMELICEAQDGEEAYELFKEHQPDIVLVDIEMPKIDGLKFIRFAKANKSDSRFVLLTCHQDLKYMREAIQLQVSDFLLKSTLDMEELCSILRSLSLDMFRERETAERAKSLSTSLVEVAKMDITERTESDYYSDDIDGRPQIDVISEMLQKRKKEVFDCIESLRFAEAARQITNMHAELKRPPNIHPHIVKNMLTEFLFRAWSACEELEAGRQAADHRLVDRLYATRKLEDTIELLNKELERLESQFTLTNSPEDKTKIILLIKQYIKTHMQQEISLQEIANAFYLNSNYLSRLFKEVSHMGFTEYVLHEKTELAIVMMKNGKTLTEISEKLGYLNLSSFTRMFKKVRGASPSRYLQ
ncbi:response regulator [Cohnella abietis]|uniref:DNA-binding response regulator n=1 Tax=Cohnella abietis TaxID=2507935 RepID=A0A3T1D617_9BACL|nr:response regulator [Cohnella abietis]BBI33499.1 hypothetical protein KCTCHS21_28980 [Cohnella abietis]